MRDRPLLSVGSAERRIPGWIPHSPGIFRIKISEDCPLDELSGACSTSPEYAAPGCTRRFSHSTGGCVASYAGTTGTTVCRATGMRWTGSMMSSVADGIGRFAAGANDGSRGPGSINCWTASRFRGLRLRIHARPLPDAAVNLRRSRVRESRSLGSVGAKAEWLSYPTIPCRPTQSPLLVST